MIDAWQRDLAVRRPQTGLPQLLVVHHNGTRQPGWRLDGAQRRDRGYHTLKVCLGGRGWFAHRGHRRPVGPGTAMLFRSNDPAISHGFDGHGADHWRWLRASWLGADAASAALAARCEHLLPLAAKHPLVRRLQGWRCAGRSETVLDAGAAAALVFEILAAIATAVAATAPPADATERLCAAAREAIARHLEDGVGVGALAAELGVSAAHLSRSFRAGTGERLQAALARQRLVHAAELLVAGSEPIKAIAERIGFAQSAHFGRAFRAHFGLTPSGYRRLGGVVG